MKRPIVFRRAARVEFDEAFEWYEKRRNGLGSEFAEIVDQAITRIRSNPQEFGFVYQDIRCAVVRRFPYGIYFREEAGTILVLAVFHGSRDPKVWQARADS